MPAWNYVHLLGKDLFVSPRVETGAPLEEERAQPMRLAKTSVPGDPKGAEMAAISIASYFTETGLL